MMLCPGCGRWLAEDAGFCRGCGTIVRGAKARTYAPAPASAPPPPPIAAFSGTGPPALPGYAPAPPAYRPFPPPALPQAPPPGYTAPPPGYTAPPPGYTPAPPSGYSVPVPPGYTPPGGGYPSPAGYRTAPASYGPPPGGFTSQVLPPRGSIVPTGKDLAVAILTSVMLLSLLLPFYRLTLNSDAGSLQIGGSVNAFGAYAGGWRFVDLLPLIAILGYLLFRYLKKGLPNPIPIPHRQLLAGLVAIGVALMFLTFFMLPEAGVRIVDRQYDLSFGWAQAWGAFVGLSAGVLALAATLANNPKPSRH